MSNSRDADALLRRLHKRLIIDGQDVHPEDALSRDIQSYVDGPETPKASPEGIPVVYMAGGGAEWTAVEVRPGWWRIKEWGRSIMGDMPTDDFWDTFTKVEK